MSAKKSAAVPTAAPRGGKAARSGMTPTGPSEVPTAAGARDADFGAANLAAVARANAALLEGMGEIGEAVYAYAQHAFSNATSTARSLIGARNLSDVVALNGEFAQVALAELLTNSIRVSEIGIRATSAALEPLGKRVADTIANVRRPTGS